MKQAFRHIIIYLLTAVLFTASTGVSFHKLYCYCKGKAVASFLKPEDPCHQTAVVETDACCDTAVCDTEQSHDEKDCSQCYTEYVSLDADYIVSPLDLKITAPVAILPAQPFEHKRTYIEKTRISWENDIPPPAGRDLLRRIQSFLC